MKTVTISTRLNEDELVVLDELAEHAGLDRSGMTRSLVRKGLREMRTEAALEAYAGQRATLSRAAEMAELSSWDLLMRLTAAGGTIHYDVEEFEEDLHADP
jgi:predicted HTH domain antitoxin